MKVLIKKIQIIMEEIFFKMIVLKNKIFNLTKEKYFKIIKAQIEKKIIKVKLMCHSKMINNLIMILIIKMTNNLIKIIIM